MVHLSPEWQMQRKYLYYTMSSSFLIPSNSMFSDQWIIQHYIIWATEGETKQTKNE